MENLQSLTKDVHLWQHGKTYVFMFSGKAGVGKTFSAKILNNILKEKFNLIEIGSFAKAVKRVAFQVYGWDGIKDERGRKLLQNVGNTGRQYNENIWADYLVEEVLGNFLPDVIIIDDWRYPNEYEVFLDNDLAKVTKIRIKAPDREILKGTDAYNDISEVSLDDFDFDFEIDNSGAGFSLHNDLKNIVDQVLTK